MGAYAQEGTAPKAKEQTKAAPAKSDSTKKPKKAVKAVPAAKKADGAKKEEKK